MVRISSDEPKQIPIERWGEWCDTFTANNRGRIISIETEQDEAGPKLLAQAVALVSIDCDPVGNIDFVICYRGEELSPCHFISDPVRLWQGQESSGLVTSLEIEDKSGCRTLVTLT